MTDEERIIQRYKDRIKNPLTGIRAMCVECMGGQPQMVNKCPSTSCALYPFRMGSNPYHGKSKKTP